MKHNRYIQEYEIHEYKLDNKIKIIQLPSSYQYPTQPRE